MQNVSYASSNASNQRSEKNDALIIAIDADFSGGAKVGGEAILRGAELAVEELNAQGGILNTPLELVVSDHRGNPARGKANVTKHLDTPNLIAVVGGVHTPVVLAQMGVVHQSAIPFLIPWAAGTSIVDNDFTDNNVFRVSLRDAEASKTMLMHAKKRGINKLSLLLERTQWGRSNESSLTQEALNLGMQIEEVQWFNWRQPSFESNISQVSSAPNKAIVIVANVNEGADIVKAIAHSDLSSMPIISHWGITAGDFVERVGVKALNKVNLSVLQSFHFLTQVNNRKASALISSYNQKYQVQHDEINIPAATGLAQTYDLIHLLAQAASEQNSVIGTHLSEGLRKLDIHQGAIKLYEQPFADNMQDALMAEDYLMATFNQDGCLEPVDEH